MILSGAGIDLEDIHEKAQDIFHGMKHSYYLRSGNKNVSEEDFFEKKVLLKRRDGHDLRNEDKEKVKGIHPKKT